MNNRYSYSRLDAFNRCPRRHHYQYIEKIPTTGNENLLLGGLVHSGVELLTDGEDLTDVLKKYEGLVLTGQIEQPEGLLERLLQRYNGYWSEPEDVVDTEWKFSDPLEGKDVYSGVIDKIVQLEDGTLKVRDTKTTTGALKVTPDNVRYHQQLLSYVPFVEDKYGAKVSCIEIDEIRVADIQPVPLNANGKPSADKRKLALVLYEDYYNKLFEMGLDDAPEYKGILDWLEKRGHPLFKRTAVQLLGDEIVDNNIKDIYSGYQACKSGGKHRVISPLCEWCDYKPLCRLDFHNPSEEDRGILLEKIIKKG